MQLQIMSTPATLLHSSRICRYDRELCGRPRVRRVFPGFSCGVLVIASILCSDRSASAQDTAKERFLREAPEAWDKLLLRAKKLQGEFRLTAERADTVKGLFLDRRHVIKQAEGCYLILEQDVEAERAKSVAGTVSVVNPHYRFILRRKDPGAPWVLVQYTAAKPAPKIDGAAEDVARWTTCAVSLLTYSFGMITKRKGFELKKVESFLENGIDKVKVHFEFHAPDPKRNPPSVKGWIAYLPQRHWVIDSLSWTGDRGSGHIDTAQYEYSDDAQGFPILKRMATTVHYPTRSVRAEEVTVFQFNEGEPPLSEFTLSAFGLPEPQGFVAEARPRYSLWFSLAGLVGIASAFILHRKLKNRGLKTAAINT